VREILAEGGFPSADPLEPFALGYTPLPEEATPFFFS